MIHYLEHKDIDKKKTPAVFETEEVSYCVAGAAGLEPATNGFGDHYSTN